MADGQDAYGMLNDLSLCGDTFYIEEVDLMWLRKWHPRSCPIRGVREVRLSLRWVGGLSSEQARKVYKAFLSFLGHDHVLLDLDTKRSVADVAEKSIVHLAVGMTHYLRILDDIRDINDTSVTSERVPKFSSRRLSDLPFAARDLYTQQLANPPNPERALEYLSGRELQIERILSDKSQEANYEGWRLADLLNCTGTMSKTWSTILRD